MFEKNLNIAFLLDFYGDVLTDRTKELLEYYYCDDLSLAEIAENIGISRQGVRQTIKKGEDELLRLENKLGLAAHYKNLNASASRLTAIAERIEKGNIGTEETHALATAVREIAALIAEKNRD